MEGPGDPPTSLESRFRAGFHEQLHIIWDSVAQLEESKLASPLGITLLCPARPPREAVTSAVSSNLRTLRRERGADSSVGAEGPASASAAVPPAHAGLRDPRLSSRPEPDTKTRDPRMNQHRDSLLVCYFAYHPFYVNRLYSDTAFPFSPRGNQSLLHAHSHAFHAAMLDLAEIFTY